MTHDLFNEHFDLVIIGHYHNAQQVDIFNYIGSSFPHNFGEDNNKGICLLYDDLSLEIIDYHFKRYINYVVDPHLVNDALIAEITNESVIHNVKLTINGTKDQTTEINRYISQLSKICATSVVTDEGNTVIENITTNNLLTTFEQYCALNDFDFKTIAPYIINKIKNYTDNE
jgi:DNA repair exonuclease SbcCD nuclease subunit